MVFCILSNHGMARTLIVYLSLLLYHPNLDFFSCICIFDVISSYTISSKHKHKSMQKLIPVVVSPSMYKSVQIPGARLECKV